MITEVVNEFLRAKEREDINSMKDSFLRLLITHCTVTQNITYAMGNIFEMIKESPLGTESLRELEGLLLMYKEVSKEVNANIDRF